MNRRHLLAGLIAAPLAPVVAKLVPAAPVTSIPMAGYLQMATSTASSGGSGSVLIRYSADRALASWALATGGTITHQDGDVIHTFTAPGTFTVL